MIFGNNSLLKYQHLLTYKSEQSKHDKDAEDRLSIQNNDISWTKQCGRQTKYNMSIRTEISHCTKLKF